MGSQIPTPAPDAVESQVHDPAPMPVTPSEGSERPDGVAFDLPAGTETPGMPRGDQRAVNEDEAQTVQESVEVPPGHLDLPGADGAVWQQADDAGAAVEGDR